MTPDDQSAEVLALHIRIKQLEEALRRVDHIAKLTAGPPPSASAEIHEIARAALDDRSAP